MNIPSDNKHIHPRNRLLFQLRQCNALTIILTTVSGVAQVGLALYLLRVDQQHLSAPSVWIPLVTGLSLLAINTFAFACLRLRLKHVLVRRQLAVAVEQSPTSIVITDLEGWITYVNPKFTELTGYSREESIGQNPRILQSGHTRPEEYQEMWETISSGRAWRGEFHNRKKNGELYWEQALISPVFDERGNVSSYIAIKEDITEHKQMLETLQADERRFRQMFEQNRVVILLIDPDTGAIVDANNAASSFYGYTREALRQMNINQINTASAVETHARMTEARQNERNHFEFQHRLAEGTVRDVAVFSNPLELDGKALLYSIIMDITEGKEAERLLRESEQRYRTVVKTVAEGIVMHDATGKIIASNYSAEQILGLTANQMMGRDSVDPRWHAVHEDETPFPGETHPAVITLRTGVPQRNVIMGVHKPEGELTWISINSEPLFKNGEQTPHAVVASFHDITERKLAEQRQLDVAVHAERVRILSQFVTGISHEFRTPLATIGTSLYLLERIKEPERQQERIEQIRQQAGLIEKLVDTMITLTRLDAGVELRRFPFQLNELVAEVAADHQTVFESADLHLTLDLRATTPEINADRSELHKAIAQLVENACKYTPPGGCITLATDCNDTNVSLVVQDTGVGMTDEVMARLYERFYRGDEAHTSPGFGLGLSIANAIVEAHEGSITVESEPGVGSTFTVTLPR